MTSDPDESVRVRDRLAAAGLLAAPGRPRPRPDRDDVARAREAAGRGVSLVDLVVEGRGR